MDIIFPKKLTSNKRGIEYISYLWGVCKSNKNSLIVWDLSRTKLVHTNLLSAIGLILKRVSNHNKIILKLKNKDNCVMEINNNIIANIFHKYSFDHREGLRYVYFNFERGDSKQVEELLIDKFRELNLKSYRELKVILSEMTANIYMHAKPSEGSICSYINSKDNKLYISICNFGKTIKQNICDQSEYDFNTDGQAILWALRKLNTTRKGYTSGGLGLYLLRKHISNLDGEIEIVSGKSMIKLKENMYSENDVNNFSYEHQEMKSFFTGVIITIKIDYIVEQYTTFDNIITEKISLNDI